MIKKTIISVAISVSLLGCLATSNEKNLTPTQETAQSDTGLVNRTSASAEICTDDLDSNHHQKLAEEN